MQSMIHYLTQNMPNVATFINGVCMAARAKLNTKPPAVLMKTSRAIRKPKITKKVTEPEEPSGPLGWARISREGGSLIEQVSTSKEELVFSSGKYPQIRMRPTSAHRDEVDYIPEKHQVDFKEFKGKLSQYRAIIMFGAVVQVRSGKHLVIVDRDPGYEPDVVDDFAQDLKSKTRARAHAVTRKHAKAAAMSSQQILEFLQESARESEIYRDTMTDLLERVLEQGSLTEADRKLLGRLRLKEGADIEVNRRRRPPGEDDLDKTEVD